MEQHLDDLGREVALARQSYDKEKQEADAIQALSHQRMAAAEQLQRQMAAKADPARKRPLERSLATLVTMLEQMAPEVEREKKDAADAKEFLETLESTYAEAGGKLQLGALRSRPRAARHGPRRTAARDGRAAGRRGAPGGRARPATTSSLTVALKAMQEAAATRPRLGRRGDEQGEAAAADRGPRRTIRTSPPQWPPPPASPRRRRV